MNAQEKVAKLEAILARVKKNAALPRAGRSYDDNAAFAALVAAGDIAPIHQDLDTRSAIADASPVLVDARDVIAEVKPAAPAKPAVEARPLPAAAKEATLEKPSSSDTELFPDRPRLVALAPPIGMGSPANKPAAADKAPATPIEKLAGEARPPARPAGPPRPPVPAKPAEAPPPVRAEPPAPPPRAPEKAPPAKPATPPLPARPARPAPRVEPAITASSSTDKTLESAPAGRSADLRSDPSLAARLEEKTAIGISLPVMSDTLSTDFGFPTEEVTKPQEPSAKLLGRSLPKMHSSEDEDISHAETKLMAYPIPVDARRPPGEEVTVVEEAPSGALLAKDDSIDTDEPTTAGPLPKLHEPDESDEETAIIPSSRRPPTLPIGAPKAEPPRVPARAEPPKPPVRHEPPKPPVRHEPPKPPPRVEEAPVFAAPPLVVEEPPIMEEPATLPVDDLAPYAEPEPEIEPVAEAAIEPAAEIEPHQGMPIEALAPPGPVMQPPPPVEIRPARRGPMLATLGLAAAALLVAAAFVGFRSGWFSPLPTKPTTAPSAIRLPPIPLKASTGAPATSESAMVTPPGASGAPAVASSATPSASPSAVTSALPSAIPSGAPSSAPSAAPSAVVSATPTAPAAPEGDGTNLPVNRGYLQITSAVRATVYANGIFIGYTGDKIDVECGPKYIRLGALPASGALPPRPPLITWLSEGRSASVACKTVTTIPLEARAQ